MIKPAHLILLCLLAVLPVYAGEDDVSTSPDTQDTIRYRVIRENLTVQVAYVRQSTAFTLGLGSAHRADTYLTPLHYDGWNIDANFEHFHLLKSKFNLLWALNLGLDFDRTKNQVRNSAMLGAQFEGRWALLWRKWPNWSTLFGRTICWQVGAGGSTTLDAGALYLSRNGNNPVAANASWTLDLSAYAALTFKIGKMPVNALYRATLPVGGVMFAPDYGQLYYEIYLGDRKGIFTGAYWGRYFRLDQNITLDFKIGKHWLRAGYGVDILSTKVHDIVSRRISHNFVIGISTDWLWSASPEVLKEWFGK